MQSTWSSYQPTSSLDEMYKVILSWDLYEIMENNSRRGSKGARIRIGRDVSVAQARRKPRGSHVLTPPPLSLFPLILPPPLPPPPQLVELQTVPDHFASSDQYIRTFEPLMLKEVEGLVDSGIEECASFEGCRNIRTELDEGRGHYNVTLTVPGSEAGDFRNNDFVLVSTRPPAEFTAKKEANANSFSAKEAKDSDAGAGGDKDTDTGAGAMDVSAADAAAAAAADAASISALEDGHVPHAFGIIERHSEYNSVHKCFTVQMRMYLEEEEENTYVTPGSREARIIGMADALRSSRERLGDPLVVSSLVNLVTTNREYQAVQAMWQLALRQKLLQPTARDGPAKAPLVVPERLANVLKAEYNESQQGALNSALQCDGFSLIQVS